MYDKYISWPVNDTILPRSISNKDDNPILHPGTRFSIYPNPSLQCFNIRSVYTDDNSLLDGLILQPNGVVVGQFSQQLDQEVCIDIPHPGIYFVRLRVVESGYTESLRIIFMQ